MSKKLKKCPFCGSKSIEYVSGEELAFLTNETEDATTPKFKNDKDGIWYVICAADADGCGAASGAGNNSKKEARKIWNKRT